MAIREIEWPYDLAKKFIDNPSIYIWQTFLNEFPCAVNDCNQCPLRDVNCMSAEDKDWDKIMGVCMAAMIEFVAMCESDTLPRVRKDEWPGE